MLSEFVVLAFCLLITKHTRQDRLSYHNAMTALDINFGRQYLYTILYYAYTY